MAQMKHFTQNPRRSSGKSESDFFHPGEHPPTAAFKSAAVQRAFARIAQIAGIRARRLERNFAS